MIGLGYHATITPPVIRRNVLEDPSWYTAYTPYQPEISQGRLEALLNFQTVVGDLTGLPTANASLLDEGTAAAEAMTLVRRAQPEGVRPVRRRRRRAAADHRRGAHPRRGDGHRGASSPTSPRGCPTASCAACWCSTPAPPAGSSTRAPVIDAAHERDALAVVAADLLALTLLEAPGALGADVVVGSSQRFGVPLFYGGPHAGFMAVAAGLERHLPGRLVGVSVDAEGRPAYRLALQTREQHIRRDKATSNICTAQVLLAVVASMYAVYHGPEGLQGDRDPRPPVRRGARAGARRRRRRRRARGVLRHPHRVGARAGRRRGRGRAPARPAAAPRRRRPGRASPRRRPRPAPRSPACCGRSASTADLAGLDQATGDALPDELRRETAYLTHEVFSTHHSETAMLRYLRRLSARDYALDRGMIPLGSCTMKLNATTEMEPISLPGFADLHPFAPAEDAAGYRQLVGELEGWLAEVTGYDRVSIQPNAGSQGELAGLLAIRGYHRANGEAARDVCLIPSSAHGTNAASAVMAGMRVVVVKAADDGAVDLDDLRAQCDEHADDLAAIMVTYPSTHGAYEDTITELCEIVHDHGGQVYVDGANLNALLGYAKPGEFGGDVSHLNLHKTFCIPHGGGGPGVGPVAVREHLAPYLPSHAMHPEEAKRSGIGPISAAPYGSAGILPISWAYIRLMGARRAHPGHGGRGAVGQLRRRAARRALPGALQGPRRAGRPRVHPRPARADQGHRRHRRRRRQAAHRLRLPRPDDVVPGRRHADGRADRVRGPRRDRPVLRRDDRDPRRDRPGRRRGSGPPRSRRCAAPRTPRGRWSASGTAPTPASSRSSRPASTPTSTGRRWRGSTRRTATATWSAPARRPRPSPRNERRERPVADLTGRGCSCTSPGRRSTAGCRRSSPACSATAGWPGRRGTATSRATSPTCSTGSARSPRP